jgi:hypothetical protein
MPISLYDATIPSYLQVLRAVVGLIDKAEAFCTEKGITEQEMLTEHFGPDMLPLAMQLKWVSTHSIGAIESVRAGTFSPDGSPPPQSFEIGRAHV